MWSEDAVCPVVRRPGSGEDRAELMRKLQILLGIAVCSEDLAGTGGWSSK